MIDKSTYIQMKRDIKCLCRKDLLDLCDVCMDMCISRPTYAKYMKTLLSKIYYYKNTH